MYYYPLHVDDLYQTTVVTRKQDPLAVVVAKPHTSGWGLALALGRNNMLLCPLTETVAL